MPTPNGSTRVQRETPWPTRHSSAPPTGAINQLGSTLGSSAIQRAMAAQAAVIAARWPRRASIGRVRCSASTTGKAARPSTPPSAISAAAPRAANTGSGGMPSLICIMAPKPKSTMEAAMP
jgi:hypothetical protein